MRKIFFAVIAAAVIAPVLYFAYQEITRPPHALEVDPTKDTTDVGIQYRIRTTNIGTEELTGIEVDLGGGDVQQLALLPPGQSYYFYPKPDTVVTTVKVKTNEGISIESDFRSPTKVLGLPGSGR